MFFDVYQYIYIGDIMFFKKIDSRIKIVLVAIIFAFIVIILRVGYVQLFDYKKLKNKADDLWSRNLPILASYEPGSTFNIVPPESDTFTY